MEIVATIVLLGAGFTLMVGGVAREAIRYYDSQTLHRALRADVRAALKMLDKPLVL